MMLEFEPIHFNNDLPDGKGGWRMPIILIRPEAIKAIIEMGAEHCNLVLSDNKESIVAVKATPDQVLSLMGMQRETRKISRAKS